MTAYDENGLMTGRPFGKEQWAGAFKGTPIGRRVEFNAVPPGMLIVNNCMDPRFCNLVRGACDRIAEDGAKRSVEHVGDAKSRETAVRSSESIDIGKLDVPNMHKEIIQIIGDTFRFLAAPFYGAPVEWFERPDILRYGPGAEYWYHADADTFAPEERQWKRAVDRDVSILVYLNGDFEGGELHFPNFDFRLKPTMGLVVAFPSDARYVHAALPVTEGRRHAIVSWAALRGGPRAQAAPPKNAIQVPA